MSDDESEYYSDPNSNEEFVQEKSVLIKPIKKPQIKYEDEFEPDDAEQDEQDEEDENEDEEDEEDDEDDENDENEIIGGGEDDDADPEEDSDIEIDEEGVAIEKQTKVIKPKKTTQLPLEIVEDEDDDEYEENYLQKFDNEMDKNYITEFHPECLNHNSDEVMKLSKVVRDENNIIIDPLHRTLPYLTKYEKARILGQRSKQIETGCKPLVKVPENIIDSYIIAELELREKKIPFIIKRPIPGGAFEYWSIKDLENINF